jgi:signal-transduction protein with cAMP-binding, CBS, and nucleotidyltransferase domain
MVLDTFKLRVGDYMTPDPITVGRETKLKDAIDIMARKNIGNLVVNKNGKPSSILTEREILTYIVKEGQIPDIEIKDVPTKLFAVVTPSDLVLDAAKTTIEEKKRLLVFEQEKIVGIMTVSDMLKGLRTTGGNPKLDSVVRKKVYDCIYHDSIFKAIKIMYKKRIGSVIITKDDIPYGIFTERDLLTRVLVKDADMQDRLAKYSTSPLVTAHLGIQGNDAAEIMAVNKIKRLALTKEDKVVGMVTARDIVDAFGSI